MTSNANTTGAETPVSYTHAVTKARKIVGPRSGKELVAAGIVAQDDEHDGRNGKWYVNVNAITAETPVRDQIAALGAANPKESNMAEGTKTEPVATTQLPAKDDQKLDSKALMGDLVKQVKGAVRGVTVKPSPKGDYVTIKVGKTPIAYTTVRRNGVLLELALDKAPTAAKTLTFENCTKSSPRFNKQALVTKPEQAPDVKVAIEAAAAAVAK